MTKRLKFRHYLLIHLTRKWSTLMNIKQINNIMQINFEDEQMTLKTHNFAQPQLHE